MVNIRTESHQREQELTEFFGGDDMLRRFFGQPQQARAAATRRVTVAAGTGFIIAKEGLILTNNHVVEGADKVEVSLYGEDDDLRYKARVVGRDPLTDSALIELTEKPDHIAAGGEVRRLGPDGAGRLGRWRSATRSICRTPSASA